MSGPPRSRLPALAAMGSIVAIGLTVTGAILHPSSILLGGALVSMLCLAGSIHAIGRTHAGG